MTKVKWSIETNDIDTRFLTDYDNVHKSMEDRHTTDFYEAQRHIQSAMMGDKIDSILTMCPILIMSTIEFQSQCITD